MARRLLAPALFFALAAVLLTWPVAARIGAEIPGRAADDNVNFLWNLWWMREALATLPANPFHTNLLFHPFGVDLTLHTHTALPALVGATVLGALSVASAQSLLLLLATTLNGFCMYLLALRLTRSIGASIVAGLYFASSPYFAGHLLGHFNLHSGWGLPLFALTFLVALDTRRWAAAAASGVVLAAVAYTDYYYVVYLAALVAIVIGSRSFATSLQRQESRRLGVIDWVILILGLVAAGTAVWIAATGGGVVELGSLRLSMTSGFNLRVIAWIMALIFLWRRFRPRLRLRIAETATIARDLAVVATAAVSAAILTAPLWIGAIRLWRAGDYRAPARLWRSSTEGVDLVSLVAGNPFHPLWRSTGEWIYATVGMSTIESTAWLGVVPLAILWMRWPSRSRWPLKALWLGVAAVFFVWALGPYLRVAGVNTGLMLPETILHYVPIVSNARIPGRAMVMVYLAVAAMLAGALATWHRRNVAIVIAGAAILIESIAAPVPMFRLPASQVDDTLARRAGGAAWELPFGIGDGFGEIGALDNAMLFHQTTHHKPLVGGFVARLPASLLTAHDRRPALKAMLALSTGEPFSDAALDQARQDVAGFMSEHDIRYLVLNTGTATPALRAFVESLPLRQVMADAGRVLFERQ